jgi:peptidoglycan-N-acetylglucosamine deacetylase
MIQNRVLIALVLGGIASTAIQPASSVGPQTSPEPHADSLVASRLQLRTPPPLERVAPQIVAHGSRNSKRLALTFDACATRYPSHYDSLVTRILIETGAHATIFLGGKWMEDEQAQTIELASHPQFELANHTYLHPHLKTVSDERIREELARTQAVMYTLTGRQAAFFRPPYGEYDERVIQIAASMGLHTIEYDLPSGDPDVHATKEKLIEYVTQMARNGSIIVMHINKRGWHTAEALPEIIKGLRARGFELVTVGELLGVH